MRRIILKSQFIIACVLIVVTYSCNKEKSSIIYPSSGVHGINVLSLSNGSTLSNNVNYSFNAELGKRADLKIVMTNLSVIQANGKIPVWFYAQEKGWEISNYEGDNQIFNSQKDKQPDVVFNFANSPGSCRVDFYENSSTVTHTKTFNW